jgi:hypothetical protein
MNDFPKWGMVLIIGIIVVMFTYMGYSYGFDDGWKDADAWYANDYSDGHSDGYYQGIHDSMNISSAEYADGFYNGSAAGMQIGYYSGRGDQYVVDHPPGPFSCEEFQKADPAALFCDDFEYENRAWGVDENFNTTGRTIWKDVSSPRDPSQPLSIVGDGIIRIPIRNTTGGFYHEH